MIKALIYKPQKSPMQSGKKNTNYWVLEISDKGTYEIDPLTGWKGMLDSTGLITLKFNNKGDAIFYADKNGIDYEIVEDTKKKVKIKSYADNFKYKRKKTDI